jgi:3-phenylpropionate/trans-cinnamate dioxygenase ferredoxin reductase component
MLAGAKVAAFDGAGRLDAVVTADGDRVPCDFAVVGVGIDPDVSAVAGSSVAQENGILVDELCRTSLTDIYAAGDVANHLHPIFGRIRVEHYNSAEHHGAAAARSMLGLATPFDYVHNFWSDQYEHILQYVGHATTWDDFVVRGSLQDGKLVGVYLTAGVVRAAVGFDRGGDPEWEHESEMAACARLVARRASPGRGVLADETTDLWSLA